MHENEYCEYSIDSNEYANSFFCPQHPTPLVWEPLNWTKTWLKLEVIFLKKTEVLSQIESIHCISIS